MSFVFLHKRGRTIMDFTYELDGQRITLEQLQEAQKNPNTKVVFVEEKAGTKIYKTLQRLDG